MCTCMADGASGHSGNLTKIQEDPLALAEDPLVAITGSFDF